MQYYNVHTHSFTMNNAPRNFLQLYLPKPLANAIDTITDVKVGSFLIQKLLNTFGGNGGKRYSSFLNIGKSKYQLKVFEDLREQYKDDSTIKFVALTMDMEKCGAGDSSSGYEGQLEEILQVKKRYPDHLLLFLGIDPRWKLSGIELRDTVIKYFETKLSANNGRLIYPFIGLKIYPSMGFYPFDIRLKETFEWAALNNVPVLSHCNYLGGIYNNDQAYIDGILNTRDPYNQNAIYPADGVKYEPQKMIGRWILGRQKSTNNLNKCSYFMEPAAFETLLKYFEASGKPLKLCLAHFGGGNQITAFKKPEKADMEDKVPYGISGENWFVKIKHMMKHFSTLYTDISYALHDSDIHDILLGEIDNSDYGSRVLFGTDFFLTERESPELDTYRIFKQAASNSQKYQDKTAWDRAASINIEGFLNSKFYNGNVI